MKPLIPVFDVGGVLLDFDVAYLYRKIFADQAEMRRFFAEVLTRDWWIENLDRGRPFGEAVEELAQRHPQHRAEILAADRRWPEMVGSAIAGTVEILEQLRANGQVIYAITNFPHEKFALSRELWPFLNYFTGTIVSGDVGMIKPEPEIYRHLLRQYDLSARDCLFIDDSFANVDAAIALGMHGHHFKHPDGLRRTLEGHGIL